MNENKKKNSKLELNTETLLELDDLEKIRGGLGEGEAVAQDDCGQSQGQSVWSTYQRCCA